MIEFPRTMPDELPVFGLSFVPEPMAELTPLRSGRVVAKDSGPTLWRASWETTRMRADEIGVVRAWYDTLLSYEAFHGYDHLREYPLAYRLDGFTGLEVDSEPFEGTCTLADIDETNRLIDLEDLPAGFVLSPGDYLAFDYGSGSRALHRVSAGGEADAEGELALEVRPRVRPGWQADATVHLHRAAARMMIVPGSWQERTDFLGWSTVSFEAVESPQP